MNANLDAYQVFVHTLSSEHSKNLTALINRMDDLDAIHPNGVPGPVINVPGLLASSMGLGGESGEFLELVKKLFFQSKPLTPELLTHLTKELGDIIFYWCMACNALNLDANLVIAENVRKLESRYPGGCFDVSHSEVRQPGDV
jgi:NTP pyrophosphatase (non-canonical NTP hydrolase)